jgi:hypothetical protein
MIVAKKTFEDDIPISGDDCTTTTLDTIGERSNVHFLLVLRPKHTFSMHHVSMPSSHIRIAANRKIVHINPLSCSLSSGKVDEKNNVTHTR